MILLQRPRRGFTLIELLIVIGIILLLAALAMPLGNALIESGRKVNAAAMVAALHAALRTYSAEDVARRFPPAEADGLVRRSGDPAHRKLIDLLVPAYINAGVERLVPDPSGGSEARLLLDPWKRPYRYRVDAVADATVARPDAARADWNARGVQPFGYIWSLGKPRNGTAEMDPASDPDAAAGSGAPWVYVQTSAD